MNDWIDECINVLSGIVQKHTILISILKYFCTSNILDTIPRGEIQRFFRPLKITSFVWFLTFCHFHSFTGEGRKEERKNKRMKIKRMKKIQQMKKLPFKFMQFCPSLRSRIFNRYQKDHYKYKQIN